MRGIRVKSFSESLEYDYAVCEIVECERESYKIAMTETRFVDFCKYHYEKIILGEK